MSKNFVDNDNATALMGAVEESIANTRIFKGTFDEYNALTPEEKAKYSYVATPEVAGGAITDAVTDGDMRPVTSNAVYGEIQVINNKLSHVGMIIHSTTLDTEAKVKAIYGGTTWIQHSGYVLRGASSGVVANSNIKTGGSDDAVLVAHSHKPSEIILVGSGRSTVVGNYQPGASQFGAIKATDTLTDTQGESGTNKNIPNYKSVYIWERTA